MKITNKIIIKDDNPLIKERSLNVPLPLSIEDQELMDAMIKYVEDSTNEEIAEKEDLSPAVGISAIQVGEKKKMLAIVLRDENDEIEVKLALVNPVILSSSIEEVYLGSGEGCLSVPKHHEGYVYRSRRIKVRAYDALKKEEVVFRAHDYLAIVLKHEIDHMSGILYYDHINKKDPFIKKENAYCLE